MNKAEFLFAVRLYIFIHGFTRNSIDYKCYQLIFLIIQTHLTGKNKRYLKAFITKHGVQKIRTGYTTEI